MPGQEEMKFAIRVVMDKEKTKVLFAEVDNQFADVLLSLLILPLGTIMRILLKHYVKETPVIGSLSTLYQSLVNLDQTCFWTSSAKKMLLNPRNLFQPLCQKLKLNLDDTEPSSFFICENFNCIRDYAEAYVSIYRGAVKCGCGKLLNREIPFENANKLKAVDGGFTPATASFLISDDLHMKPNLPGSSLEILRSFGITNADGLQKKAVVFGLEEIMELLKGSLTSKTPLTDAILHKRRRIPDNVVIPETGASVAQNGKKAAPSNSKKMMTVKAFVQKSANKVLIVQSDENFVDFLFGLLRIPLGRVLCLLNTSNNSSGPNPSIYNLYGSVANLEVGKYLKIQELKNMLLRPPCPQIYRSKYQILPLHEQETPTVLYCYTIKSSGYGDQGYTGNLTTKKYAGVGWESDRCVPVSFIDLNKEQSYVKGPITCMVTDDLVVSQSSAISSLDLFKVPFEDIVEMDFDIGMEEALNILKASLSSTSALTYGLPVHARLMKQPK